MKPNNKSDNNQGRVSILPDFAKSIENWREGSTGDWVKDNALGRERAEALRAHIKFTGNLPALGCLTKMIAECGQMGGVEAGFYHRISEFVAR